MPELTTSPDSRTTAVLMRSSAHEPNPDASGPEFDAFVKAAAHEGANREGPEKQDAPPVREEKRQFSEAEKTIIAQEAKRRGLEPAKPEGKVSSSEMPKGLAEQPDGQEIWKRIHEEAAANPDDPDWPGVISDYKTATPEELRGLIERTRKAFNLPAPEAQAEGKEPQSEARPIDDIYRMAHEETTRRNDPEHFERVVKSLDKWQRPQSADIAARSEVLYLALVNEVPADHRMEVVYRILGDAGKEMKLERAATGDDIANLVRSEMREIRSREEGKRLHRLYPERYGEDGHPLTRASKPPSEVGGRASAAADALTSATARRDFRSFDQEMTRRWTHK